MDPIKIKAPDQRLGEDTFATLQAQLQVCPDLAFAHLAETEVPDSGSNGELCLFAWLRGSSLRSLRSALNLVSEAVARSLPPNVYVDVVILNSAPDLLVEVERVGRLVVECDAEERRRALAAARSGGDASNAKESSQPWWRWF